MTPSSEVLARGGSWNLAGALAAKSCGFAWVFLMARLLGPGDLGSFWIGVGICGVLQGIAQFGFSMGVLRFLSAYASRGEWGLAKGSMAFSTAGCLLTAGILAAGVFAAAPWIGSLAFPKSPDLPSILRCLAIGMPFGAMAQLLVDARLALGDYRTRFWVLSLADPLGKPVLFLLLWGAGWGPRAAPMAYAGSAVLTGLLAGAIAALRMPAEFWEERPHLAWREWMRFSGTMQWGFWISLVFDWADAFLLGHLADPSAVGRYGVALRLAALAAFAHAALSPLMAPLLSASIARADMEEASRLLKTQCRWETLAAMPLLLALMAGGQEALSLFGAEFSTAYPALLVLLAVQLINVGSGSVGDMLNMSQHYHLGLFNAVIHLAAFIGFNWAWLPAFGILGAAMALGVSTLLVRALALGETACLFGIHPFHRWTARLVLGGAAAAGLYAILPAPFQYRVAPLALWAAWAWGLGLLEEDRAAWRSLWRRS